MEFSDVRGLHDAAKRAIASNEPVRALDLLDEPFLRGVAMTTDERRENHRLEAAARELDARLQWRARLPR